MQRLDLNLGFCWLSMQHLGLITWFCCLLMQFPKWLPCYFQQCLVFWLQWYGRTEWSCPTRSCNFCLPRPFLVGVHTISNFCLDHTYNRVSSTPIWQYCCVVSSLVLFFCASLLHSLNMCFIGSPFPIHNLQSGEGQCWTWNNSSSVLVLGCKNKCFSSDF